MCMSKDEFTKLFKYVEKRFDQMDDKLEDATADRAEIKASVVELGVQLKDYHQELVMLAHKVDRMEKWIHQIAEKTGVKLEY